MNSQLNFNNQDSFKSMSESLIDETNCKNRKLLMLILNIFIYQFIINFKENYFPLFSPHIIFIMNPKTNPFKDNQYDNDPSDLEDIAKRVI